MLKITISYKETILMEFLEDRLPAISSFDYRIVVHLEQLKQRDIYGRLQLPCPELATLDPIHSW